MVVLDRNDHIAELNVAAAQLLDARWPAVRGQPVTIALGCWPALLSALAAPTGTSAEVAVERGGASVVAGGRHAVLGAGHRSVGLSCSASITDLRRAEARFLEHERALTAVHEREHLARDLHDTIGQVLAYAGMQADAARQLLSDGHVPEADGALVRLGEVARESHRDLRRYISELNTGAPRGRPLRDSLGPYVKRFGDRYGIQPDLHVSGPVATSRATSSCTCSASSRRRWATSGGTRRRATCGSAWWSMPAVCTHRSRTMDAASRSATRTGLRPALPCGNGQRSWVAAWSSSRPGAGTRVVLEVPVAGTSTSRAMPGELLHRGGCVPVRVLLADEHRLLVEGLVNILVAHGIQVVATAADGMEAVTRTRVHRPDVVLMDVRMPRCDGLPAATRRIKAELPETRIVITTSDEDDDLFEAVRSGACGYLLKSVSGDELVDALHGLEQGVPPLSRGLAARLLVELARTPGTHDTPAPV